LAELLSGQYQGDIVMTPEQLEEYKGGKRGKTGLRDTDYRWPDNTIPYEIVESDFSKFIASTLRFFSAHVWLFLQMRVRLSGFILEPRNSWTSLA
jgi:hypothetical protein